MSALEFDADSGMVVRVEFFDRAAPKGAADTAADYPKLGPKEPT